MRIDLHTHSRFSDGTQSPTELLGAAAQAGLDVLALTDHDTAAGWPEAREAALAVGVELVRGMEISTRHQGYTVHLLGYLPDPDYPPLVAALERILAGRSARVPEMLARLRGLGIAIEEVDVARVSGDTAAAGRPHVADALVQLGAVPDRSAAFDRYLNAGRPAYVDRYAAELTDMIDLVRAAGGVCVIAHPWGRRSREVPDADALATLVDHGLVGLEVDHQDHGPGARSRLRAIAADLGLIVTGSSDHHGAGKVDHELGVNTTDPEQYARLLAAASASAAVSGRDTPGVVRP